MPLQPGGHARAFAEDAVSFTVSASATPHAKGPWRQLFAATTADHGWLSVNHSNVASAVNSASAYDIGVGPAGAEVVVLEGSIIGGLSGGSARQYPLRIPSGSRVAIRLQSAVASRALGFSVGLSSLPKFLDTPDRATTYGFNAATSSGVAIPTADTANVKGAWQQLVAATTNPMRWAVPMLAAPVSAAVAEATAFVDFGYGPAGQEVQFAAAIRFDLFTSEETRGYPPTLPVYLPAGVRLAVRSRNTTTTVDSQPVAALIGLD